jgi:hypothetical protein
MCPSCQKKFDENIDRLLAGLREAHVYAQHTLFKVEFHIKESTEKPKSGGA